MRGGGARTSLGLADLVDDERDAGFQRLLGHPPERVGVLHVLQQHQDGAGLALVENKVGEVERLQAGLIARGHDVAEGQLLGAPVVEEGEADAAALRDHRHLPALGTPWQQRPLRRLHGGTEGRAQRRRGVGEAFRVWPHHGHAVAPRDGPHLILQARAIAVGRLREAGAQHDGRTHAGLAAALQLAGHVLGRNNQHGQVGRRRQLHHGRIGLQPHHLGVAAADGIERAGERVSLHHLQDTPAQTLHIRRYAHQGHCPRPQQLAEVRPPRLLAHERASTRVGPPVAPLNLGAPTTSVAPRAGTLSRLATHSSPHRPEGSQA